MVGNATLERVAYYCCCVSGTAILETDFVIVGTEQCSVPEIRIYDCDPKIMVFVGVRLIKPLRHRPKK